MRLIRHLWSPAAYVVAACLFFLPFVGTDFENFWPIIEGEAVWSGATVAVGGQGSLSLHVVQFDGAGKASVQNTTLTELYGEPGARFLVPHEFLPSQPLAIVAVVLILGGVLAGVLAGRRVSAIVAALAGLGGAAALTGAEVLALADAGPFAEPRYGFWLALAALILLGAVHARNAVRSLAVESNLHRPDPERAVV